MSAIVQVRVLIADNLGILIGYLHDIDDSGKIRDVFELVLQFARDPDPEVISYSSSFSRVILHMVGD